MQSRFRYARTLCILALVAPLMSWGQNPGSPVAQREIERRSFAQNFAKAINAAEADYFKQHQSYANWDNLMGFGYFSQTGTKWGPQDIPTVAHALYSSGPEIVPGWRLRLRLSNNGRAYDVSIEDVSDLKCGYAVMTDERGKIRQGNFIACPIS
ncbi:MAG TPA: hypothetical protein VL128_11695 [Candidatus Eisenbacteria bacterium]|nr:hypothetical protein [Candidatus Eisenbacteria bacterium]